MIATHKGIHLEITVRDWVLYQAYTHHILGHSPANLKFKMQAQCFISNVELQMQNMQEKIVIGEAATKKVKPLPELQC